MTIVDDYADLISLVDRYEAYVRELNKRLSMSLLSDLRTYWPTLKAARGGRTPFVTDEKQRRIWESLLRDVDRGDEIFRAASAASPALVLAEIFLQQHPHLTREGLGHLTAMYEIQATPPPNIGKQLTGLALVVGAFAAQSVPEEAFQYMDWSGYPAYRFYVAIGTLIALGYGAFFGVLFIWAIPGRGPREMVRRVLVLSAALAQPEPRTQTP